MLMGGATIRQVIQAHPGFALLHLRTMEAFQARWMQSAEWIPDPLPRITPNLSEQDSKILRWFGMNMFEESRPIRSRQLFLYGEPMTGKTTFLSRISRVFKTYFPSDQEHYWDGFDESYQLIVFDDFRGTMKLSSILKLLDGQHMRLPQRYNSFAKTKNIPIVVSTNLPPHGS